MSFLIYRATGPTGGQYIGLTSRSLVVRKAEHRLAINRKYRGCEAFKNAIIKHGFGSFVWEVMIDGLNREEADQLERILIDLYKPRYNIAAGGTKPVQGTHSRPIVNVTTGRRYESARAAANANGCSPSAIAFSCNNGSISRSGMKFRYEDTEEVFREPRSAEAIKVGRLSRVEKLKARRHSPETIERMKDAAKKRGVSAATREIGNAKKRKPLLCIETGTVFPDAREAGMAHGLTRNGVYALVESGGLSRLAGVHFRQV